MCNMTGGHPRRRHYALIPFASSSNPAGLIHYNNKSQPRYPMSGFMILFFYCPYEKARKLYSYQAAPTVCSMSSARSTHRTSPTILILTYPTYSLCTIPSNFHSICPPNPPQLSVSSYCPFSHPNRLLRTFNNFPFRCVGFGPSASPCCVHFTFHFCSRSVEATGRRRRAALTDNNHGYNIVLCVPPDTLTNTHTHNFTIASKKERVSGDIGIHHKYIYAFTEKPAAFASVAHVGHGSVLT